MIHLRFSVATSQRNGLGHTPATIRNLTPAVAFSSVVLLPEYAGEPGMGRL